MRSRCGIVLLTIALLGPSGIALGQTAPPEPSVATMADEPAPVTVAQAPSSPAPTPAAPPAAPVPGAPATAPAPPASPPADKGPNTGRISLNAGVDWASAYFFRGIRQEDSGFIFQPYGELGLKLIESAGPMSNLTLSVGTWNSFHTGGTTGPGCDACVDPKMWYEADFIAKLTGTFFEDLTTTLFYTAYMSPNDLFATVQELGLYLSYNDSKLLGPFALNPSLLVAGEVKGQADAGARRGVYVQLGIAPSYTFFDGASYPLSVSLPVTLGLSGGNYYEFGGRDNPTFGYVQWGPVMSVPLAFVPPAFGKWQVRGSVFLLHLGKTLERVNGGDRLQVLGSVGLALTY